MRDLILVAVGGAIGASLRHLVSRAALVLAPSSFPWGTWFINIAGCFAIGIVTGLAGAGSLSPSSRLFVATGILGGFTTFSAFGLESHALIADGRLPTALAYVLGQLVLGLLGVSAGIALGRRLA